MLKQATVVLGGRNYTVSQKVMGVHLRWRETLRQCSVYRIFESLDGALLQIQQSATQIGDDLSNGSINWAAGIHFAAIAPAVVHGLVNSIDEIHALVFDYSPEIKADKDWLMENAYDEEMIAVFVEILKLHFPILALWDLIRGPAAQATVTNLPSTNGAGGTKKNAARGTRR